MLLSIQIYCLREVRYDWKEAKAFPLTPELVKSLVSKVECSTEAKAADRSKSSNITGCLLSIAHKMSFYTLIKEVAVDWHAL